MSDASAYKLRDGRVIYYKDAVARKYLSSIAASVAVEPEQQEVVFNCGDDNISAKPVLSKIKIQMNPKVVGNGTPSQTNPFKISKWNSVTINVSNAKNVVPMTVTYTVGKRIDVNDGSEKNSPAYMVPEEYIPIESGKKYYCSCFQEGSATTGFTIIQYNENMEFMPSKTKTIVPDGVTNSGKLSGSFTSDQNAKYIRYNVGKTKTDVVISEEEDFVATTKTIEIRDDLNVFGGELSHLGSNQWMLKIINGGKILTGTESWTQANNLEDGTLLYACKLDAPVSESSSKRSCSHFPNATVTSKTTTPGYYAYTSNSGQSNEYGRIMFRPDYSKEYPIGDTDEDGDVDSYGLVNLQYWKNYLVCQYEHGDPVICWWTYTTPKVYILSGEEVELLIGPNVVTTDADQIDTFEYRVDLDPDDYLYNRFLSRLGSAIAPIEKGTVASQAYVKDDYLIFNDNLCKASKAIALGDTLAIGTNLTKTTIAEELKALR